MTFVLIATCALGIACIVYLLYVLAHPEEF
ncbi:potassium-transporting ATPase subunit F [Glutamicibacter ardleyensis]